MRRSKGKLFALLMLAGAVTLVAASGAFTSVSAERTATVDVADDSQAYLAMEKSDNENGQQYVSENIDGTVEIDIAASGNSGSGVNVESDTTLDNLVMITNQGTQEVEVWVDSKTGTNQNAVTFYSGTTQTPGNAPGDIETQGDAVTLGTGDTMYLGLHVDSSGISSGTDAITADAVIVAQATGAQTPTPSGGPSTPELDPF